MLQSFLFTKTCKTTPSDETSTNARLLLRGGYIDKLTAGVYTLLPLGLRVYRNIETIIRDEMNVVRGQEVVMPLLHPREYWDTTKRWDTEIMFHMKSTSGKEYGLAWTHEEIVTPLAQKFIASYKDLPRVVYHFQTKFRDELRAKSGILRGREFVMKDMYSFHANQDDLDRYYTEARDAYARIFRRCGIGEKTHLTFASGGAFSKFSHEFQTETQAGEDTVYICNDCSQALNKEIIEEMKHTCAGCGSKDLRESKAIEVGNIFKLGTRFSTPFGLHFTDENNEKKPVIMGCYGIGLGRLLGTIVELHHDEKGMAWPASVAPFGVHLLALGNDENVVGKSNSLHERLEKQGISVLYDDRDASAGEKLSDADLLGIPVRLVISKKTGDKVGWKDRHEREERIISVEEVIGRLTAR